MSAFTVRAGGRAHRAGRYGTLALAGLVAVAIPFNSSVVLNGQLTLVLIYAIAALGLNLLVGYSGQISLGHGAFFAAGAYTAGPLIAKTDLPYLLGIPAAAAVTFLLGLAFGVPALRLRGLYLALVTLALAVAAGPLIKRFDGVTGGTQGLAVPQPQSPSWLGVDQDQYLYLLALAVAAVMFLLATNLTRGPLGRSLVAIRSDERAAGTLGVNRATTKARVFAWSAAYAGVAGALYSITLGFLAPESFTLLLSFTFLAAIVIGGLGTVGGALLGALFIEFVPQYAQDVNPALTGITYGTALIAVVYLLPGGGAGLLRRLRRLVVNVVEDTQGRDHDASREALPDPGVGARADTGGHGVRAG